jgi:hypothetical protein
LREADFGCARFDACYDPIPPEPWGWFSPELVIIILIIAAIIWLIWAISQTPAKPDKPLEERVIDHLNNAEKEARDWADMEAVSLITRTRSKISGEFRKPN